MTRYELIAKHPDELAELYERQAELLDIKERQSESNSAFNKAAKDIESKIKAIVDKIQSPPSLPFDDGFTPSDAAELPAGFTES